MSRAFSTARSTLLTTWILWDRLCHPAAHPLYERLIKLDQRSPRSRSSSWWVVVVCLPLVCAAGFGLSRLSLPLVLVALVAASTLSSLYVAAWTAGISAAIGREHERGTYETYSMSPSGALGTSGAIAAAVLNRHDLLTWIDLGRRLVSGLLLGILLAALLTTAFRQTVSQAVQLIGLLLEMIALAFITYVEHVQAVVLGSLIGILAPIYRRSTVDTPALAVTAFLALQAGTLAVMLLIWHSIKITAVWQDVLTPTLISLGVFYFTRELLIWAVWRLLAARLNASRADLI